MSEALVSTVRRGTLDIGSEQEGKFPFDAWEFSPAAATSPYLALREGWQFRAHDAAFSGTLSLTEDATFLATLFSRFSIVVKTDDYTILDDDRVTCAVMNNAAAKTFTLPTLAANQGRILAFMNKGAGEAVIDGEGAETIQGLASVYLSTGSYLVLAGEASEWKRIAGPIQPVTGEPSLGTPHKHYAELYNGDPATTNVISVDISTQVPVGTTWIEGRMRHTAATAARVTQICNVDASEVYSYIQNAAAGGYARGHFSCPVTSDRKIYWSVTDTDVSNLILVMTRYWYR